MRSYSKIQYFIVAATAALSLTATGCADSEPTTGEQADVTTTTDTSSESDTSVATDTSAPDVADPCDPNPCLNGGTCTDSGAGTASCNCAAGFDGDNCENVIDPCENFACPAKADDCGADGNTFTCA